MAPLNLLESVHPSKQAQERFDGLLGIDMQKQQLRDELLLLLAPERLEQWLKRHHPDGLPLAESARRSTPLVILSGEVGCGKTALATSVGTPVAKELGSKVVVLETPSDIRGTGMVGELSARITDAFSQAKAKVRKDYGLLVIDEADDLALSRAELQAHHEDRAGLNVLIKQLDLLQREEHRLGVVMITNRIGALDPAVRRRAALVLEFSRPGATERRAIFEQLLTGCPHTVADINRLVKQSERPVPYSYSDLFQRVARAALLESWRRDAPLKPESLAAVMADVEPSPLIEEGAGSRRRD
ncbi:ATP-binding protein [Archangium sp.]|uniref:ATP-binding protein n=1 Tax=Archangium sp. TaxID=1872627 RepID=UPI002D48DBA2|nr:ATP-binding protein [Archangium sp.]HYO56303.1 ATP-binding protein [Archangium sp.]